MVIITDANGNIQTPTIPENVYQGSNLANEIVFLAPLPQTNVATITFKLPNGILIEEQAMTPYTSVPSEYNLSGWRYVLNDVITQYYGQVTFQIFVRTGTGKQANTWNLKNELTYIALNDTMSQFVSNDRIYNRITMTTENDVKVLKYGNTIVYSDDGINKEWIDVRFKKIEVEEFVGSAFRNWLVYNGIQQNSPLVTTVAGTFPVLRGVPSIPHSTPSQDSWNQILNWVASINGKVANFEAGILETKSILPYDNSFIYSFGASVFDKTTKSFYTSLEDDNVGNPLSDTTKWGQTRVEGYTKNEIDGFIDDKIAVHNTSENAHQNLFNAKQDTLTTAQMDAVNSGITADKIMSSPATTSENPLVNKDFVNSSIATNTANFIGTFESVEKLKNVGYLVIYSILKEGSTIAKDSVVNGTTYNHDTELDSDLNITADSTLAFGSVIKSGSTIEIGSIINHEEYESQTTTSADIEVETITNNDYANVINRELNFLNTTDMNAYDKDLLTNYDYAWIPNNTKFDLYRFDIASQTWELRATNIAKTDVSLITAYNRYKFNGSIEEWNWEYTINTSGFTASQWAALNSGATAEQIAKIGSAALTTTAQNLSGAVNELDSGKQPKNLVFTNVSVSYLTWSPSITYADYPYQADIALTGVTANDIPEVIFAGDNAVSGDYLPVAESRAGAVRIYSKTANTITIPTIIIQKVGA